jgi:hypothetical protein
MAAILLKVHFWICFLPSCKPVQYVASNHIAVEPKKVSGGMGMTYKSQSVAKAGPPLSGPSRLNKNAAKSGSAFHVFERSNKKRKPDLSLFPAGVSNKFRLKDRHTNEKKAARMLKKEEKNKGKEKKQ